MTAYAYLEGNLIENVRVQYCNLCSNVITLINMEGYFMIILTKEQNGFNMQQRCQTHLLIINIRHSEIV